MRTVKELKEELSKFPDDAVCFAYEGEVTGITITPAARGPWKFGFIYCCDVNGEERPTETWYGENDMERLMEIIKDGGSITVHLSLETAERICLFGQEDKTCAFIGLTKEGFMCLRMDKSSNGSILERLECGKIWAKGRGGWPGCIWEGKI